MKTTTPGWGYTARVSTDRVILEPVGVTENSLRSAVLALALAATLWLRQSDRYGQASVVLNWNETTVLVMTDPYLAGPLRVALAKANLATAAQRAIAAALEDG